MILWGELNEYFYILRFDITTCLQCTYESKMHEIKLEEHDFIIKKENKHMNNLFLSTILFCGR